MDDATIAAIATPPGTGAIGIVRLSGHAAAEIAETVFRRGKQGRPLDTNQIASHRLIFGTIWDPVNHRVIDEVMLAWMRAPHTYTGENTVELYCHGGLAPLQETLRVVLAAGARMAQPGEFTLRAWLNGKLDLSQAEAVQQVVSARTAEGLRLAMQDLAGDLSSRIAPARQALISLLAYLDAAADFPEDEISRTDIDQELETALLALQAVVAGGAAGMVYRDGVQVALVGRPNAGKSSLMNALLRSDRAIVTPVAGTTRDVIAETTQIEGIPVTLLDTAGISETVDMIERLGIERSERAMAAAAAVLLVLDGSVEATDQDMEVIDRLVKRQAALPGTEMSLIVAVSKSDLPAAGGFATLLKPLQPVRVVEVSAVTGQGLPELERALANLLQGDTSEIRPALLTTRQQAVLEQALVHIQQACHSRQQGFAIDLLATDVRAALQAIGAVTGEDVDASVLSEIFSRFCIGK